ADRLIWVSAVNVEKSQQQMALTLADVRDWQARQTSFSGVVAFDNTTINLSGDEKPERFDGGYMAANVFDVLGVKPILGRTFLPGEDHPHSPPVPVVGAGPWSSGYVGVQLSVREVDH